MSKVIKRIFCIIIAVLTVTGVFAVCAAEKTRETEIVSVRVSEDGSTLTVTATLSDSMFTLCKGKPIYLFEFYPCDKNADLAKKAPVAFQMAAEELTFELDMTGADPQRKYSKFILATGKGTGYKLIGNVVYVENPEAFALLQSEPVQADNMLGIIRGGEEMSDKFGHAVVPVYVNELFADTADGSIRYEYGDNVYYIDTEVLTRLDSAVKSISEAGTAVYLQLLLGAPDESTANLTMSLYSGTESGRYFAPNTADSLGVRLWSSLVEFLCSRYSAQEYGCVNAFILGDNVNVKENYAYGGETEEEFLQDLGRTLRITDTAIRSTCSGVGLYLSLGGQFSGSHEGAYPARDVLDALCGDGLRFGVYMDVSVDAPAFWLDETVRADSAASVITPKNIDVLIDYLSQDEYLQDGDIRPLMLGYSADGTSQDLQAASALCAFYRAISLGEVDALIYNCYTDTEGNGSGLMSAESLPKVVYSELCTAAEGDELSISDQIRALLGASEYESLRDSVLSELFVVRSVLPVYSGDLPAEVDALYLADFVDGGTASFEFSIQTETHGSTMDSTGKVLRLTAKKDTAGMSRVFGNGYNLNDKNILVVELKALSDDESSAFTFILDGLKDGAEVSLTSTVQLRTGEWNELAFDVSGIDTLTGMNLTVASAEGGALTWYIKDITVFSSKISGSALAVKIAVAVLIAVLVLFIILLVILIYMRSRRRPAASRYTVSRRKVTDTEEARARPEARGAPRSKERARLPRDAQDRGEDLRGSAQAYRTREAGYPVLRYRACQRGHGY